VDPTTLIVLGVIALILLSGRAQAATFLPTGAPPSSAAATIARVTGVVTEAAGAAIAVERAVAGPVTRKEEPTPSPGAPIAPIAGIGVGGVVGAEVLISTLGPGAPIVGGATSVIFPVAAGAVAPIAPIAPIFIETTGVLVGPGAVAAVDPAVTSTSVATGGAGGVALTAFAIGAVAVSVYTVIKTLLNPHSEWGYAVAANALQINMNADLLHYQSISKRVLTEVGKASPNLAWLQEQKVAEQQFYSYQLSHREALKWSPEYNTMLSHLNVLHNEFQAIINIALGV